MSAFCTPRVATGALGLARLGLFAALAITVAGCSHSGYHAAYVTGDNAYVSQAAMPVTSPPKRIEIEDDGLPVQVAPFRYQRRADDDPTEPFSPNYGTVPLRPEGTLDADSGRPLRLDLDADRPGETHEVKLTPRDEASIIAKATANHGWRTW